MGRLIAVTLPEIDPSGTATGTVNHTRPRYEYGYDAQGNQTYQITNAMLDADGVTVKYYRKDEDGVDVLEHSRTLTTAFDENWLVDLTATTFDHDERGRQTSRTLPMEQSDSTIYNDSVPTSGLESSVGFGEVQRVIDLQGRVTDYVYDNTALGHGRLVVEKHAMTEALADDDDYARVISYTYDAFGRVTQIDDDVDGITRNVYDADGRLTQVDRSGATDESILNHSYDVLGRLTSTWTSEETDGADKITETIYGYNNLGQMTSVTQSWRNATDIDDETTEYRYDALGRLDLQINPADDNDDRLVANYDYDTLGRLVTLTHFLDADGDLTLDTSGGGEKTLAKFEYLVDATSNRMQATETFDDDADGDVDRANVFTWTYDGLNRLVRETYDGPEGGGSPAQTWDYVAIYSFDLASNRARLQKGEGSSDPAESDSEDFDITTYAYDANDRLKTEVFAPAEGDGTTIEYGYNNGGDQISKTTTPEGESSATVNYTYDVMGRMTGVDTDGDSDDDVTYQYDHTGVRVSISETVGEVATTTKLVIDAMNPTGYTQVLEERNASGGVTKTYTVGMDVLAQATVAAASSVLRLLYDAHGSTRGVVGTNGQTAEHYNYDAYGNLIHFIGIPVTPLLYSGECRDRNTGLDYLRARHYAPTLGRFTSKDTYQGALNRPQTLNGYLYTWANPISLRDSSGYDITDEDERGDLVHALFSAWIIAHRPNARPNSELGTLFPGQLPATYVRLRPDYVDEGSIEFFDLKPISHRGRADFQYDDNTQMAKYDAAFNILQGGRGNSSDLLFSLAGTDKSAFMGLLTWDDTDYEILLYAADNPLLPSGYDGKGLIWYELRELGTPRRRPNPFLYVVPIIDVVVNTGSGAVNTGRSVAGRIYETAQREDVKRAAMVGAQVGLVGLALWYGIQMRIAQSTQLSLMAKM